MCYDNIIRFSLLLLGMAQKHPIHGFCKILRICMKLILNFFSIFSRLLCYKQVTSRLLVQYLIFIVCELAVYWDVLISISLSCLLSTNHEIMVIAMINNCVRHERIELSTFGFGDQRATIAPMPHMSKRLLFFCSSGNVVLQRPILIDWICLVTPSEYQLG